MGDSDGDPALGAAVELRQRDAGHTHSLSEQPCLLEAVLPRRRVDDEQRLVRRTLQLPFDDAPHLRQLLHQVRLGVQTPRGVDDDDVAPVACRPLDRLVGDRCGVRPALGADERRVGALRPDLQLLFGGRAKRVCSAQDDRMAVLAQPLGQLADRRRLAGAVDADDEQDARVGVHVERRRFAEQIRDLFRQGGGEVGDVLPPFEPLHERGRRGYAHVGTNQSLFETLPRGLVARIECCGGELGGQRLAAFRERIAETRKETRTLRLRFRLRSFFPE